MFTGCQLGAAVMGASLFVSMLSNPSKKAFMGSLTAEQTEVYRGISRKRLMIYAMSLLVGGVVGYGLVLSNPTGEKNMTTCKAVGVAALVSYLTYMLWPKKRWMLQYTTPEQTVLWLKNYRDMSFSYHMGFVVFLVGYAILMRSQCGQGEYE
ncbi:hypothetical protein TetV_109 [Tetraselmis virus 1]|uniref:Uncharacterized protein n=1 Tax=Tetraselmis virus 1 TaxID=2060617 RepID=A0A2P0VMU0_9VIRU|nr:hypothetical protein QJ968_gp109 [Tetraselmis virus 1]AUF82201.1 hypothetical protein TetV_109 [Tetraselmis virus 1]